LEKGFLKETPLSISFKTVPGGNAVGLKHNFRVKKTVKSEEDSRLEVKNKADYSYKNSAVFKYNQDIYHARFHFGNSFMAWRLHVQPTDFNKDDKVLEIKHDSKFKPQTSYFSTHNGVKFGSPKVGPLRFWTNAIFQWDNQGKNAIKHDLNVDYNSNVNIGYKLKHDLTKLVDVWGLIFYKGGKNGDFFLKSECLKHHIILGYSGDFGDHSHSAEIFYDIDKNTDGIKGQPLIITTAHSLLLNANITVKSKFEIGKEILGHFTWN